MHNITGEQAAFVSKISREVSPALAQWVNSQFTSGRHMDKVISQMRRVIGVLTPLRSAETPVTPETYRTDTEFNLNWAEANPELFVQAVKAFQTNRPITHWRHFVDLSRGSIMKLIAVRRDKPFETVTDYVMEDKLYLTETGYDV